MYRYVHWFNCAYHIVIHYCANKSNEFHNCIHVKRQIQGWIYFALEHALGTKGKSCEHCPVLTWVPLPYSAGVLDSLWTQFSSFCYAQLQQVNKLLREGTEVHQQTLLALQPAVRWTDTNVQVAIIIWSVYRTCYWWFTRHLFVKCKKGSVQYLM